MNRVWVCTEVRRTAYVHTATTVVFVCDGRPRVRQISGINKLADCCWLATNRTARMRNEYCKKNYHCITRAAPVCLYVWCWCFVFLLFFVFLIVHHFGPACLRRCELHETFEWAHFRIIVVLKRIITRVSRRQSAPHTPHCILTQLTLQLFVHFGCLRHAVLSSPFRALCTSQPSLTTNWTLRLNRFE